MSVEVNTVGIPSVRGVLMYSRAHRLKHNTILSPSDHITKYSSQQAREASYNKGQGEYNAKGGGVVSHYCHSPTIHAANHPTSQKRNHTENKAAMQYPTSVWSIIVRASHI